MFDENLVHAIVGGKDPDCGSAELTHNTSGPPALTPRLGFGSGPSRDREGAVPSGTRGLSGWDQFLIFIEMHLDGQPATTRSWPTQTHPPSA